MDIDSTDGAGIDDSGDGATSDEDLSTSLNHINTLGDFLDLLDNAMGADLESSSVVDNDAKVLQEAIPTLGGRSFFRRQYQRPRHCPPARPHRPP